MRFLKELMFWWFLIDTLLLIISKKWRNQRIDYLKSLDNQS